MMQDFLTLLTVLVFTVLAVLVRIYVPLAIAALNRKAEAVLGAANRDALYAAVKVGLNAASKHGLNGDDLLQKAISVASMYLNQHRIPVSTALLNEAIRAEQQKRDDRKAEFGVLTLSEPEPAVPPAVTDVGIRANAEGEANRVVGWALHTRLASKLDADKERQLDDEAERLIADAVAKAVKAQV